MLLKCMYGQNNIVISKVKMLLFLKYNCFYVNLTKKYRYIIRN